MLTAMVVIAVRGGASAKGRCAPVLDLQGREALTAAMLGDMLEAVSGAAGVSGAWVVTPTAELAELAASFGATPILEPEALGLGEAFTTARRTIADRDPNAMTVLLPGDLPRLDPVELAAVVASWRPGEAVLAPAKADGGTGAILIDAVTPFSFAYGPGSLQRHVASARAAGLSPRLIETPGLAFDLDQPADIASLLALPGAGRTRALLASHPLAGEAAA